MTRDEARALIADTLGDAFDVPAGSVMGEQMEHAADAVLDALFAQGNAEYRVVDRKGKPFLLRGVSSKRPWVGCSGNLVQVRRVVFVSDEWKDETDG